MEYENPSLRHIKVKDEYEEYVNGSSLCNDEKSNGEMKIEIEENFDNENRNRLSLKNFEVEDEFQRQESTEDSFDVSQQQSFYEIKIEIDEDLSQIEHSNDEEILQGDNNRKII